MPALRASDLRFLLGLVLALVTLASVTATPERAAVGAFLVWAAIAGSEAVVPALQRSPPPSGAGGWLAWALRLFVPLQLLLLADGLAAAAAAGWPTVLGLAYAVGFVTGSLGITYAHDLGHSRLRADRALAWILMTCVAYPQFMVEHYRGHHLRAATPDDPATARLGESLWRFLPRTLAGNFRNAWRLEAGRLRHHGRSWANSPLAWSTAAVLALVLALGGSGQWKMLAFWVLQAAFAVWLLEAINYIEHYGLVRRAGADGRPEPFGPAHAWNTDTLLGNSLLANLQRHSDHHVHAGKPYGQLEALAAPQLPTGYAGCILLAALPPLWFRVMHPRLHARIAAPA